MVKPTFRNQWRATRDLLRTSLPQLKTLLWTRRWRLGGGIVLLAASRAASLVLPASSKFVIDEVIIGERPDVLTWILIAVAGATLIQAMVGYSLAQLIGVTGLYTMTDARRRLMSHVVRLPVRFFDQDRSGELASRIYFDSEQMSKLVGAGLLHFTGSLLTAVLAAAVLIYIDWRLSALIGILLLLLLVVHVKAFLRLGPLYREQSQIIARTHGRLVEMLGGVRTVKAYTAERREERSFTRGTHEELRRSRAILSLDALLTSASSVGLGLVAMVVLFVGVRFVLDGVMSLGDLVTFVAILGVLVAPLNQAAGMASEISRALVSLDRITQLEDEETEPEDDRGRLPLAELKGDIRFENVCYAYESERHVLRHLTFTAAAGSTTALVGPSGAGKSTIFRLLLGFDAPASGRVLVDGLDLRTLRRADYRQFLGVVLQDDFLFDRTILDNIMYAKPRASRDEAIGAGRAANCEEFVTGLPHGWDTVIGEGGVRLSGGQRQRVAIARAVLADPRILLLDEATSSLDSTSEALVRQALEVLRRERTTIVIAHRLSTVRDADHILVLDRGRLLEQGRHEDLLRDGRHYREIWAMQAGHEETTASE